MTCLSDGDLLAGLLAGWGNAKERSHRYPLHFKHTHE